MKIEYKLFFLTLFNGREDGTRPFFYSELHANCYSACKLADALRILISISIYSTYIFFMRISVSPATEKLIGQSAQAKVARVQWRHGSCVFASTRQRSVLFHKVPFNELENCVFIQYNPAPLDVLLLILS